MRQQNVSTYMTISGYLFSIVGALIYATWTFQGFVNGMDDRISKLEYSHTVYSDKISEVNVSLQRQQDKIDKIYLMMVGVTKHANID